MKRIKNHKNSLKLFKTHQKDKYSNKRIGEEKPHIFAIADNAYTGMKQNNIDQEIHLI